MVPLRIRLVGFLSYRDEQIVDFRGASLWLLCGANGSGKSALFDALTFALYGQHRGGGQNYAELINKESTAATVELDFQRHGQVYRARRSLRRSPRGTVSTTQQLFSLADDTKDHAAAELLPIADTERKADFDRWINTHLGMDYDTFTSSVLLLQGKAEKLLDAKPSARAEALAKVVHLERYQKLHEQANARKLAAKAARDAISQQLERMPDVSEAEYTLALRAIETEQHDRERMQADLDRLMQLERQAVLRQEAAARLEQARSRYAAARALLAQAHTIETKNRRRLELIQVLPVVKTVLSLNADREEAQNRIERYTKERAELIARRSEIDREASQLRRQVEELRRQQQANETRWQDISEQLRQFSVLLEKVNQLDELATEWNRIQAECAQFPPDLPDQVATADAQIQQLAELQRDLELCERLQQVRRECSQAEQQKTTLQRQLETIKQQGLQLKNQLEEWEPRAEQARAAQRQAEQLLAVARTQLADAEQARGACEKLTGESNCTHCGQPLSPEHLRQEIARREQALRQARIRVAQAEQAVVHNQREAADTTETASRLTQERNEAREQFIAVKAELANATQALERTSGEIQRLVQALSAAARARAQASTNYPTRQDLAELQQQAATLEAARARQQQLRQQLQNQQFLVASQERLGTQQSRLAEPLRGHAPLEIRQKHATLSSEETALKNTLKALKFSLAEQELLLETRMQESHACLQRLTDLQGKINTEDAHRKHHEQAARQAREQLPEFWQAAVSGARLPDYSKWSGELNELQASDIEAKARSLEQSRLQESLLQQQVATQEAILTKYPREAEQLPAEIRLNIAAAKTLLEQKDQSLLAVRQAKVELDQRREQRTRLFAEVERLEREFQRYKLLAELLGRDRLQRQLVRQAERQIVAHANEVLARLSAGQLVLQLATTDDDTATAERALDLEVLSPHTNQQPVGVTFLSGSQRFRVAVSLALALGQFASQDQLPMRTLIIDEGFGSLDRQGRQIMLQELENLRGQLECILVVSHQEDFVEVFQNSYRFSLEGNTTRVSLARVVNMLA